MVVVVAEFDEDVQEDGVDEDGRGPFGVILADGECGIPSLNAAGESIGFC